MLIKKKIVVVSLFVLLFASSMVSAQNKIVTVNAKVGELIDRKELDFYQLESYIDTLYFEAARFILISDSTYILRSTNRSKTINDKIISRQTFMAIGQKIDLKTNDIAPTNTQSQPPNQTDTSKIVSILMFSGKILTGKIINQNSQKLTIQTEDGDLTIEQSKIRLIGELFEVKNDPSPYPIPNELSTDLSEPPLTQNPDSTLYLLSGSAIAAKAKSQSYQTTYFLSHTYTYALTDKLTLGVGTTFPIPFYYGMAKIGFPIAKKLHIGGSIFIGKRFYYNPTNGISDNFGLGFGTLTYGTSQKNITINVGMPFFGGIFEQKKPIAGLSAMFRIPDKKMCVLTENWLLPTKYTTEEGVTRFAYFPSLSAGIRTFDKKKSWTYALVAKGKNSGAQVDIFPTVTLNLKW